VIGLLSPYREREIAGIIAARGATALAMELVPRITRAQGMDALSSQANIAGYRAVLLAAARHGRYFPLLMTAAGTIPPARVVIMGAGVAGLQAVATARRLGAVVEVSDIRPAVKEQVESLGAKFIELPQQESGEGQGGYAREMTPEFLASQRAIVTRHIEAADVVITTALVPGKRAPLLVTTAMVEGMKPGAIVVDLAATEGGNCELSRGDEEVVHGEVLILAPTNLAASMAMDASTIYARNVLALLLHMVKDGKVTVDPADEIVGAALLTHGGKVTFNPAS
jgi:NAD(P) transhydrogenase subunit alpha